MKKLILLLAMSALLAGCFAATTPQQRQARLEYLQMKHYNEMRKISSCRKWGHCKDGWSGDYSQYNKK